MKIYIDLIILQDTIITSLILILFNKLFNIKTKLIKIIGISFLGSIFTIISFIFLPDLRENLIFKFIVSFVMIKLCLGKKIEKDILINISSFWLITILFGGIGFVTNGNLFQMVFLFIFTAVLLIKLKIKNQKKICLEAATCFLMFEYNGKKYQLKALVDTGHNVGTIYGEDVIFVSEKIIDIKGGEVKEKRIVSYKTVSGEENKNGIKLYDINISYGNKKVCNNAVIVSTPNILEYFDAIVGLSLIEGGWTNGNIDFDEAKSQKIIS